jgi:glutaredoxin/glutathione-dependent peroxiredoxin
MNTTREGCSMGISVGMTLPEAGFVRMGEKGPETVTLSSVTKGRKVVLFGLPGAFTGTCSTSHIPSFIRTAAAFRAKGIAEIICVSVNDPFVLNAWGEATGATAAGITHLGDADGSFTHALGMEFTAPAIGLIGRSNRYAVVLDDGVVTVANVDAPGVCDISTGEALLEAI